MKVMMLLLYVFIRHRKMCTAIALRSQLVRVRVLVLLCGSRCTQHTHALQFHTLHADFWGMSARTQAQCEDTTQEERYTATDDG